MKVRGCNRLFVVRNPLFKDEDIVLNVTRNSAMRCQ